MRMIKRVYRRRETWRRWERGKILRTPSSWTLIAESRRLSFFLAQPSRTTTSSTIVASSEPPRRAASCCAATGEGSSPVAGPPPAVAAGRGAHTPMSQAGQTRQGGKKSFHVLINRRSGAAAPMTAVPPPCPRNRGSGWQPGCKNWVPTLLPVATAARVRKPERIGRSILQSLDCNERKSKTEEFQTLATTTVLSLWSLA